MLYLICVGCGGLLVVGFVCGLSVLRDALVELVYVIA